MVMAIVAGRVDSTYSGLCASGAVEGGRVLRSGEWTRLTMTAQDVGCRHRERKATLKQENGEDSAHLRHEFSAADGDDGQCVDGEGRCTARMISTEKIRGRNAGMRGDHLRANFFPHCSHSRVLP